MKLKNVTYAGALLAALALSACSNDLDKNSEWGNKDVRFTSVIAGQTTRVANGSNAWEDGDQIGIYMTKPGEIVGKAIAANQLYKAAVNGTLSAAGTALEYPEEGNVDFIAYYPYTASNDSNLTVDVSDQTKPIDLLYAKSANIAKSSDAVKLSFSHQLSYIVLNVSSSDGSATSGLKVTLSGTKTAGLFNLNDKKLTVTDASVKDITFNTNAEGTIAAGIALPATSLTDAKLTFALGDKKVEKALPATSLEAGSKYNIAVDLKGGTAGEALAVNFGTATITDWTSGAVTGDIDVDFGNGGETPEPQPGVETTIFEETMGATDANKQKIANYTAWTATGVTYSDETGNADVRVIAHKTDINRDETTKINNVWFPAGKDATFNIAGIKAAGYTKLTLTYEAAANVYNKDTSIDLNKLTVSFNGAAVTIPSKVVSSSNKDANVFFTYTIELPVNGATDTSTLLFKAASGDNALGLRLANIKLVGTK